MAKNVHNLFNGIIWRVYGTRLNATSTCIIRTQTSLNCSVCTSFIRSPDSVHASHYHTIEYYLLFSICLKPNYIFLRYSIILYAAGNSSNNKNRSEFASEFSDQNRCSHLFSLNRRRNNDFA